MEDGDRDPREVLDLLEEYGISARLTFSNSLLRREHLSDPRCNKLCRLLESGHGPQNGVIVHSELLLDYLRKAYPGLYFVSSTWDKLNTLTQEQKDKTEFLCNECCAFGCQERRACYEAVSRKNLGEPGPEHRCTAPGGGDGYRFSKAMENPGFIGIDDIQNTYLPMGFSNFKIEGRGLGSALVLEFLLYYMTKPEYQLRVREEIYLDNMLDLF